MNLAPRTWSWDRTALNALLLAASFEASAPALPAIYEDNGTNPAANFPDRYVTLKRTAKRFSIEQNLMVALHDKKARSTCVVSPVGALGLMQLMPTTAAGLLGISVESEKFDPNNILQPSTNVYLGCRYFKKMLKNFGGKVEYALAAYNAGPGAVSRWRKRGEVPVEVFVEEIPYEETRNYVKKVLSWKRKYEFAASSTSGPPAQSKDQRVQTFRNSLKRHKPLYG